MPSKICDSCLSKAQQAYIFKQQVENSEVTLKQHFYLYKYDEQQLKEPKVEVAELGRTLIIGTEMSNEY